MTVAGFKSEYSVGYRPVPYNNEDFLVFSPLHKPKRDVLVIPFHGMGGGTFTYQSGSPARICAQLAQEGCVVFASGLGGGTTWGNELATLSMEDVITAAADLYGTRTDKVILFVESHGAWGFRWAADNIPRVGGIVANVPAVDYVGIYTNNPSRIPFPGIRDALIASYTNEATFLTRLYNIDPMQRAPELAHMADRIDVWYGLGDIICPPSEAEEFIEKVGCTGHPLPGNHDALYINKPAMNHLVRRVIEMIEDLS